MMHFSFRLHALEDISLWGSPEKRFLHWFGLSDGWYWIDLGEIELFRYTPQILSHWSRDYPISNTSEMHPYVDYQVARLWEDILYLLLAALLLE